MCLLSPTDPPPIERHLLNRCEAKALLKEGSDTKSERLAVETKLVVRSTAPWIKAPALLFLHHGSRNFEVEVSAPLEVDSCVKFCSAVLGCTVLCCVAWCNAALYSTSRPAR